MIDVEYYRKENGECPFAEFMAGLRTGLREKLCLSIYALERYGPALREPISKSLGDGLFELRTVFGSDTTRTLFFFVVGGRAIITNGFVKKSQKTPTRELRRAKKYREDWLKRYG